MQEIRKFPSFSLITATCRAAYEKVNRLNVAVARAKSLAMLVAMAFPQISRQTPGRLLLSNS